MHEWAVEDKAKPSGAAGRGMLSRPSTVTVVIGMLVVVWTLATSFGSDPRASADPLPGGLGPCAGTECPVGPPPIGNGPIAGRDASINLFVGGDFSVVGRAAEAEGRVVVMGDVAVAREAPGTYNVGAVGVGSQVPPPEGSTFLAVGGNTDVAAGVTLTAVKPDPNGAAGDIRGVSRSGAGAVDGSEVVFGPEQAAETAPSANLADELTAASQCYARPEPSATRPPTGTVTLSGTTWTFAGDGSSSLQVFTVTGDLTAPGGQPAGVAFTGVPAGATVLVNVLPAGGSWTALASFDAGGWQAVATRLLWNVPDATDVNIGGPVQWYGTVLTGNQASTATVTAAGINGRFLATGDVIHGSPASAGGEEFHWFPFDGDLPGCAVPPTTTTSSTTTTISSTTTSSSTVPPTSVEPTTTAPTETTDPADSTSTTISPVEPTTTGPAGTTPGTNPELPATG